MILYIIIVRLAVYVLPLSLSATSKLMLINRYPVYPSKLTDSQNQDNLNNKQTLPQDHNQLSNPILDIATEQYRQNRPFYFYSEYLRYLFANTYFTCTLKKPHTFLWTKTKIGGCVTPFFHLYNRTEAHDLFLTSTRTDYTNRADERRLSYALLYRISDVWTGIRDRTIGCESFCPRR